MKWSHLARRAMVGVLSVAFVIVPVVPPTTTAAAGEQVRLMVELVDADSAPELDPYSAPRDTIRHLSSRSPRLYEGARGLQLSRDIRRWRSVVVAADEARAVERSLAADPAVASVRRAVQYRAAVVPNDTEYIDQYYLHSSEVPLADINAQAAWDVTTGSPDTVIAVIDSGVDLTHEDLAGKIWTNSDETPGNGVDDDANGYVDDVHGWDFVANAPAATGDTHATHVAGIAAAQGNNGIGVAGIDWQARVMSVRVLGGGGFGWEDRLVESIGYAVSNGADIINMSLIGPYSPALMDAIENAYASGVIVVAAAGNDSANTSRSPYYPVCADVGGVDMVLGVGATDEDAEPAYFSNYGDCLNVSAPGDDIVSTKKNDRYGQLSGTSMSAPIVAGVAGLYLARNPGASAAQVIAALSDGRPFHNPDDPEEAQEWDADYGGRLDAAHILGVTINDIVHPSPSPSPSPVFSPSPSPEATPDPSPSPSPSPSPTPESSNESSGGGDSGGGGGGGGGGGDQGPDPEPEPRPQPKPKLDIHPKANMKLLARLKDTFRHVFGRLPTTVERTYWTSRIKRAEKRSYPALLGALLWHKAQGKTYDPNHISVRTPTRRVAGKVAGARSTNLIHAINRVHRQAYGRNPTVSEHGYWFGRVQRGEKTTETALLGAMVYHRLSGITH